LCSDRDRLDENLPRRIVADVILASVSTRAIGIGDASWFAFPALTVEASGVRRVFDVTDVRDSVVAVRVVSANIHWLALVANALRSSLAVGVVNTSWFAKCHV